MWKQILPGASLLALCGLMVTTTLSTGQEKKLITNLDELPRHEYRLDGSATDLVFSESRFREFAHKLRSDIESTLAEHDIQDKDTLQKLEQTLLEMDFLEGHYDLALKRIHKIRELEQKAELKPLRGLIQEAMIKALTEVGKVDGFDDAAFRQAFREHLRQMVAGLPWETVEDGIEGIKGQMELLSENVIRGMVQGSLDVAVEASGALGDAPARQVSSMRFLIVAILPIREDAVEVFAAAVDANRVEKPDHWKDVNVTLEPGRGSHVTVAIWDTGMDAGVFPGLMHENPAERLDGKDSDGNGFVDDRHGIAYDLHWQRVPELLYPLGDAASREGELREKMKGYFDLQASIDSPEAAALKKEVVALKPEEVTPYFEDLGRYGIYVHGTHVGGIVAEGNPHVRMVGARLTADYHVVPEAPTMEDARRAAKAVKETVDYFKSSGVRVVNMSWGVNFKTFEQALEVNGIGKDADERAEMARELFAVHKKGLYEALESAPEILFVCAAGNEDSDVKFDEFIPAAFDLPNVLTVGAVDQAGEPTSFTSFGQDVYGNGFEVESYLPGGKRMKLSGTSMSSPNVANLAAKLLALQSSLTTKQLVDIILRGCDRMEEGDQQLLLINPKRSVELLGA
jgi:hypothetical protein